ncbi:hypothetical protein ACKVMT_06990 [Halobacteriales archaeon Cl-PHB]
MTLSTGEAAETPVSFHVADPDEYADHAVRCPLCGIRVDGSPGTPSLPTEFLVDDEVALALDEDVPVFGYVCGRHREQIRLLAPAVIAPGNYVGLEATVDGETVEVAIPAPVLEEVAVDAA